LIGGGEQKTEPRKIKEKIRGIAQRKGKETECTEARKNGCQVEK
jgi:hypothetical protein